MTKEVVDSYSAMGLLDRVGDFGRIPAEKRPEMVGRPIDQGRKPHDTASTAPCHLRIVCHLSLEMCTVTRGNVLGF